MTRDELGRHLYIHAHDADVAPKSWQDSGTAKPEDVEDYYARAGRQLAEESRR